MAMTVSIHQPMESAIRSPRDIRIADINKFDINSPDPDTWRGASPRSAAGLPQSGPAGLAPDPGSGLPAVIRSRHGAYLDRWYREHEQRHNDGVNRLVVRFAR